jgi:hypothetical protein
VDAIPGLLPTSKQDLVERSETFWNPGKTRFWQEAGVDGWAGPGTGSGGAPGPQPPYPHPSNREPG